MAAHLPSSEVLQSLLLHTLERTGTISDTRNLALISTSEDGTTSTVLVGPSLAEQSVLKAAVDSLETREVR